MISNLKFKGDIEGISELQFNFITSVLEKRGYTNEQVLIEPVGKAGENYLSNVKRISIQKNGDIFKMIVKLAPKLELLRLTMNASMMFYNEHVMYTEVLPKFADLQTKANVPDKEKIRIIECYGSLFQELDELILLEDLGPSNFIILNRFVPLADDTVKLVLKNIAKFHALSYAMKKHQPETYRDIANKLLHMWVSLDKGEESKMYFRQLETDMLQIINNKYKDIIKGTVGQITTFAVENHKIDTGVKQSVIQHGDAWINNFMFSFMNQKPKECCLIDYQIANDNNPVLDLHYLIFTSTDHNTRSKYFHEWIKHYHSELKKALVYYDLDVNSIYPKEQLDADMKRYGKLCFCIGVVWASMLCRESPEASQLKEAFVREDNVEDIVNTCKMTALDENTVSRFKNIVEGLIKSYMEFGYL